VQVTSNATFNSSEPRVRYGGSLRESANGNTTFDVLPNGRALIVQPGQGQNDLTRIDVVLNWFAQLGAAR
jgi:hypothetical protein